MLPTTLALLLALPLQTGRDTLSAVDLYGLRTVPEAAVREAIGLHPGDAAPDSAGAIRRRVRAIPGVAEVEVSRACCARDGGALLYVGIRETGTPPMTHRPEPIGAARLPAEIVAAGAAFDSALQAAVRRGASREDGSRGYSLMEDPAARATQERFVEIAASRFDTLRSVLRTSADPEHRALAAQILAYAPDRRAVARELLRAVDDPGETVRNNAVRALAVLAGWARAHPESGVEIPAAPFLRLLDSVSWSDRNKGVFALVSLTASRDPVLLRQLRTRALPALVEMARWSDPGHALGPFLILARVAGLDDESAARAWEAGERETVIRRATAAAP